MAGNRAYLADGVGGVKVFDSTDPARPVLAGQLKLERPAGQIVVSGQRAFVHDANRIAGNPQPSRLDILDLSDPAAPVQVGQYANGNESVTSLAVAGERGYATRAGWVQAGSEAHWKTGLRVLDVRDPANLVPLGQLELTGTSAILALDGGRAYVATADGLEILDVSNPASPVRVGRYEVRGQVTGVVLTDLVSAKAPGSLPDGTPVNLPLVNRHALVGVARRGWDEPGESGVHLLKVGDPSRPERVALYPTGHGVMRLAYADGRLHVITTLDDGLMLPGWNLPGSGLLVLDVRDPARPVRLGGSVPAQGYGPYDLAVAGDHLLLADGARGLRTLRLGEAPRLYDLFQLFGTPQPPSLNILFFAAGGSDPAAFTIESAAALNQPVQWEAEMEATLSADGPGQFRASVPLRDDGQRIYRVKENR